MSSDETNPEFADEFVTFNLKYDPASDELNAPINFRGEKVPLETLFTDVLDQVGLSYKVLSAREIDIFKKDPKQRSADAFGESK